MDNLHVFLGPSLDLNTAKKILPQACYHPPIQCGDIIRLLRLNPDKIVIIDGLYETTPAVWHKEILWALEKNIEVWGAASMGALRAAELFNFGMHGFGEVFEDFKTGKLSDDDEVAVLHLHQDKQFTAINDAMVNIRTTCEMAFSKGILTHDAKNTLLDYCKSQFYAYRSLKKAIQHVSKINASQYAMFSIWLDENGLIDVKRRDALLLLEHLHASPPINVKKITPSNATNVMTCFLRELVLFTNTTPFAHDADWLPQIEKDIQSLHHQSPLEYMLLAEVVSFAQRLAIFLREDKLSIQYSAITDYIKMNQLYSPADDFMIYKNHTHLSDLYLLICQSVCLSHLTQEILDQYLPIIAHYYALPKEIANKSQKVLQIILVLIFSINQQVKESGLMISPSHFKHHLKQLKNWRGYSQTQFKHWLSNPTVNRSLFTSFLQTYLRTSSVYLLSNMRVDYHQWIYDAYAIV